MTIDKCTFITLASSLSYEMLLLSLLVQLTPSPV